MTILHNWTKRMKGLFHMVEAIIAITFMLTFLIMMRSGIQPAEDTGLYQEYGYEALSVLDKENLLRTHATLENFSAVENELNRILPSDLNESVEICYVGARCVGNPLPSRAIYVASYVTAGNETYFKPAHILLRMWRV